MSEDLAAGFENVADAYERGRAGWPASAVERLVAFGGLEPRDPVLDLAAGTGKLTRELVAAGLEVVAVEPSDDMRRHLLRLLPGERVLGGRAEELPIESSSVRAVAVAEAFHWFDADRAAREIARVLTPGGVVALLWHRPLTPLPSPAPWREELRAFLAELRGDAHPAFDGDQGRGAFERDGRFAPFTHELLPYEHPTDRDALIAEVASFAYVAVRPPAEREAILKRVAGILDRHGVDQLVRPLPVDLWLTRLSD